jgi:hypothetical protein
MFAISIYTIPFFENHVAMSSRQLLACVFPSFLPHLEHIGACKALLRSAAIGNVHQPTSSVTPIKKARDGPEHKADPISSPAIATNPTTQRRSFAVLDSLSRTHAPRSTSQRQPHY